MITGYYINLDKAVENVTFDQQLNILKLDGYIERFSGVEPCLITKRLSRGEYVLPLIKLLKIKSISIGVEMT